MAQNQGEFKSKITNIILAMIAVPSLGLNAYYIGEKNDRLNEIYEIVKKVVPEHENQHKKYTEFIEVKFPQYTKFQDAVNAQYGSNLNDINYQLRLRPRYDISNTKRYDQ